MTDFDKLIKEKAEQAEYTYKPAAWRSFRRYSGLGRGAWIYGVVGASSAVILGGALVFVLNREPNSVQEPTPSSVTVVADSACEIEQPVLSADTLSVPEVFTPSARNTTPTVRPTSVENKDVAKPSSVNSEKPTVTTSRYGRPLVIDVDTIKDNVPTDEELRNGHSRLF